MYKNLFCLLLCFLFSGCSIFGLHKQEIEQGNVITTENAAALRPGMSQAQVKNIMGNPVLINIFTPNRVDYVYTLKENQHSFTESRLTCIFEQGRLRTIQQSK